MRRLGLVLLRKAGLAVLTLWVVSVAIFVLVDLYPKNPAFAALGQESTPEQRALFRQVMHLDDPPVVRYGHWLNGMLHGDFGVSAISARPIQADVLDRLRYTSILTLGSFLLSLLIALPLAIFAARRAGGRIDTLLSAVALSISALPEYVIALCLLLLLAAQLRLLPVVSTELTSGNLLGLVLPMLTLALVGAAYVYRFARVNVVETISAAYVRAAVLRGFSPSRVLWLHVMPNASVAVVNVIALNVIYLFGGVIVVENVFAYPGLGTMLVAAINAKDFPMIEAVALIMSTLVIVINMVADAVVFALNPRLRSARA